MAEVRGGIDTPGSLFPMSSAVKSAAAEPPRGPLGADRDNNVPPSFY